MLPNFRKKQKRGPVKSLAFAGMGLLIAIVFFGLLVADLRIHNKKKQLDAHLDSLAQKVEQMQIKNEDLKEGILNSNNPEYIEKVAREELGLQQPGETVVAFVQPEPEKSVREPEKQSILEKMIGALAGWIR